MAMYLIPVASMYLQNALQDYSKPFYSFFTTIETILVNYFTNNIAKGGHRA